MRAMLPVASCVKASMFVAVLGLFLSNNFFLHPSQKLGDLSIAVFSHLRFHFTLILFIYLFLFDVLCDTLGGYKTRS